MCGINATFAYHGDAPPVDKAELGRTRDAMARRGPDAEGLWISPDRRVGLGHRRLTIIDLSEAANQPMHWDGLSITYNGEIYNFRRLRRELEAKGHTFRTDSDTEVLLHLYREYGTDMVAALRGMYAFALWDERGRRLVLARDPFGIKPLYYADDGRSVRVASQVKALLAGGKAGTGPDPAGHVGFFLFGSVPEPHTLYADIRALPAGSVLVCQADGPRAPERFFDVGRALAEAAAGPSRVDLRTALLDSVVHHLVADVPVGVFLSAGLDSATLVALASEAKDGNLRTLTLGFDEFAGSERDEVPLAEAVARAFATRHESVRVAGAEFHRERARLLAAMDQPSVDGVNTYFVAKAAADRGLKVALSGLGGDELFAGYDTFRQVPALVSALGWVPGLKVLGRAFRLVSEPVVKHLAHPKVAGLLELGTRYGDAYLLRRGLYMPWELTDVLDAELVREGWRALDPLVRLRATAEGIAEPARKVAALEMTWYMRNQLLRDADWAGMAHGLEIRVPLVDAELFGALAPAIGRPGGPTKGAMAACPKRPLPAAVVRRRKTGFFIPVHAWIGEEGQERGPGLRAWAREVYAAAMQGASERAAA